MLLNASWEVLQDIWVKLTVLSLKVSESWSIFCTSSFSVLPCSCSSQLRADKIWLLSSSTASFNLGAQWKFADTKEKNWSFNSDFFMNVFIKTQNSNLIHFSHPIKVSLWILRLLTGCGNTGLDNKANWYEMHYKIWIVVDENSLWQWKQNFVIHSDYKPHIHMY